MLYALYRARIGAFKLPFSFSTGRSMGTHARIVALYISGNWLYRVARSSTWNAIRAQCAFRIPAGLIPAGLHRPCGRR